MKTLKTAIVCLVAVFAFHAIANETKKTETKTAPAATAPAAATTTTAPTPEQMMAEAMKSQQPSEGHKQLEPMVGKWDYTVTMWMDPKGKPETMSGTAENTMILDGRFLHQVAKSAAANGMPAFEGQGFTGFDNVKGEYNSTWIDNMSTGTMRGTGKYDAKSKTIAETGTYTCPIAKETLTYNAKLILKNKNAYKYEMFTKGPDGKEFKSMEIAYKRAK